MKRMVLTTLLFMGIATFAEAQSSGKATVKKHSSSHKAKKSSALKKKAPQPPLDNSKEYDWPDGQRATPTGKQATSMSGDQYSANNQSGSTPKRKKGNR